jgi:hypothetical protein
MMMISKGFDRKRSWLYFQALLGIRLQERRKCHENNKQRHPVAGAGILTGNVQVKIRTISH